MRNYDDNCSFCAWALLAVGVAIILGVLSSGCVTQEKIRAAIWLNNGPLPADLCDREPELRKYGFYRKLKNGKIEFKGWCDADAMHWLSMFDRDFENLVLEANENKKDK